MLGFRYRQISNTGRNKSQHLHVSRSVLQFSLHSQIKPGVKSRMRCSWSTADRLTVDSSHKESVMHKMFPFNGAIMIIYSHGLCIFISMA